jgi:NAD(P)-dependent dehydrogenase (short-subunit alcohol dehydrogenase family)
MEVNVIGADPGDPGLRPADGRHREQRGAALAAIVNFGSSVAGKFGGPFLGAYVASKHAIGGLSEIQHGLAELPRAPDRRRVVSIAKGKRLRTLIVRFPPRIQTRRSTCTLTRTQTKTSILFSERSAKTSIFQRWGRVSTDSK